MKKEFTDIEQLLNDRAEELARMKNNRMAEIREAERKYHEIEKQIDNAETATDFVRLKDELKQQEDVCRFLTSHKNREPKYNLSKAEHKEISDKITKELEEMRAEYAPKIAKALEEVIAIADEYSEQCEYLEELNNKASMLATNHGANLWRVQEIENTVDDPMLYIHAFYRSYFPARANVCKAKKALNTSWGKTATWMDSETLTIYNYLKSIKEGA